MDIPYLSTTEITQRFVEFYRERDHVRIQGSSLIPPPDDPVLYTTSGMHPLTRYLGGESHPLGTRLVNVQRCLRTTDLSEVGDRTHLTVFQMLGTWSLGDYPGEQSLRWGYELLTEVLGIRPELLHVSVFGGDKDVGADLGSLRVWEELGVPIELGEKDNWWSNGPTGPCGPDSEIFVWTGPGSPIQTPSTNSHWVEIWNHVMMRHRRLDDGSLIGLGRPNVDTGMGLERLSMVMQGKDCVYDTDLFKPWLSMISQLWELEEQPRRIVLDHVRSSLSVIGEGVVPHNTGRGYVLRRLVRRSLGLLWKSNPESSLGELPDELLVSCLSQLEQDGQRSSIIRTREVLHREEQGFLRLIQRGRPLVERELRRHGELSPERLRCLHETHGLPPELVSSLVGELTG